MTRTSKMLALMAVMALPGLAAAGSYWVNTDKDDCKVHSPVFYSYFATITWTGGCEDGKANGPGTLSMSGNVMEVTLDKGYANGHAKVKIEQDNMTYDGPVKDLLFNGKGKLRWGNGTHYEGDFVDGTLEGFGRKTYASGEYYEGQFKKDKRNGKGIYVWEDGTSFEGNSKMNKFDGVGVYTDINGDKWKRTFKNDKLISDEPLEQSPKAAAEESGKAEAVKEATKESSKEAE